MSSGAVALCLPSTPILRAPGRPSCTFLGRQGILMLRAESGEVGGWRRKLV